MFGCLDEVCKPVLPDETRVLIVEFQKEPGTVCRRGAPNWCKIDCVIYYIISAAFTLFTTNWSSSIQCITANIYLGRSYYIEKLLK